MYSHTKGLYKTNKKMKIGIAKYRKKGMKANGETKIIIEYYDDLGRFRTFTLPNARTLLKVLKAMKNPTGLEDAKNRALKEPIVHEGKGR